MERPRFPPALSPRETPVWGCGGTPRVGGWHRFTPSPLRTARGALGDDDDDDGGGGSDRREY